MASATVNTGRSAESRERGPGCRGHRPGQPWTARGLGPRSGRRPSSSRAPCARSTIPRRGLQPHASSARVHRHDEKVGTQQGDAERSLSWPPASITVSLCCSASGASWARCIRPSDAQRRRAVCGRSRLPTAWSSPSGADDPPVGIDQQHGVAGRLHLARAAPRRWSCRCRPWCSRR